MGAVIGSVPLARAFDGLRRAAEPIEFNGTRVFAACEPEQKADQADLPHRAPPYK